jgi:hypothetical protein
MPKDHCKQTYNAKNFYFLRSHLFFFSVNFANNETWNKIFQNCFACDQILNLNFWIIASIWKYCDINSNGLYMKIVQICINDFANNQIYF